MLVVAAIEFRSPVGFIVPVEADDLALHRLSLLLPDVACARVATRDRTPPEDNRERNEPADEGCDDERDEHAVMSRERSLDRCGENPELRDINHDEQDHARLRDG